MEKYIDIFEEIEARRVSLQPYTPKIIGSERINFHDADLFDLRLDEDGDPNPLAVVAWLEYEARRKAKETPQ